MFKTEKVKQHYRVRNGKKFLVNPFNRKGRKKEDNKGSLLKKVLLGIGVVGLTATVGTLAFKSQYSKLHPDSKKYVDLAINSPREVLENFVLKKKYKLGSKSKNFNFDSLKITTDLKGINSKIPTYQDIKKIQEQVKDKWDQNLSIVADNLRRGKLDDLQPQPSWINNKFIRKFKKPVQSLDLKNPNKTEIMSFNIGGITDTIFNVNNPIIPDRIDSKILPKKAESFSVSSFGSWANVKHYGGLDNNPYRAYLDIYAKGYDSTTVETAVKAYKSWKKYPDKNILITGNSSGGWMANDAALILERAGVPKDKVFVVTMGGEKHLASPEYANSLHLLDKEDMLSKQSTPFSKVYDSNINWEDPSIKKQWQDIPLLKGHLSTVYLNENKQVIRDFINPPIQKTEVKKVPKTKENLNLQVSKEIENLKLKLQNLETNLEKETSPNKKEGMLKGKKGLEVKLEKLQQKLNLSATTKNMYYLADFARPLGTKDKQQRERRPNKLLADVRTIGDKAIYGAGTGFAGVGMLPFRSSKVEDALQSKHMNKIPFLGKRYRKMAQDITPKQIVGGNRVGRYLAENLPAQSVAGAGLGLLGAGYGAYKVVQNRRKNRYD